MAEFINRRLTDVNFSDWVYLLVDHSFDYIAGNLKKWPTALGGFQEGWSAIAPSEWQTEVIKPQALRATYQILPDGHHLLLGRDTADLDRFGARVTTGFASAALLFLVLAAAAGISTSRRSVARIEAINATSREMMRSGLGERIPLCGTGDEWDGLAENLNSMLDRIEALVETNRQVSDNVADDLRTPLTRMRGRLERACNRQLDVSNYQSLVNDTISDLDEILTTFASLLRISQIEARDRTAAFRHTDLGEIVREVVELFEPTAEERAIRLQAFAEESVSVVGDRDLLFDAISNLVDNAIKHGGDRGEISIAVARCADGSILSIGDRGPGIPIEQRNHVLRRFYRLQRSRNRPGNGLGLSLVAAVASLHGAHIVMADNSPGLRIELHFRAHQRAILSVFDQQEQSWASGAGRP